MLLGMSWQPVSAGYIVSVTNRRKHIVPYGTTVCVTSVLLQQEETTVKVRKNQQASHAVRLELYFRGVQRKSVTSSKQAESQSQRQGPRTQSVLSPAKAPGTRALFVSGPIRFIYNYSQAFDLGGVCRV